MLLRALAVEPRVVRANCIDQPLSHGYGQIRLERRSKSCSSMRDAADHHACTGRLADELRNARSTTASQSILKEIVHLSRDAIRLDQEMNL